MWNSSGPWYDIRAKKMFLSLPPSSWAGACADIDQDDDYMFAICESALQLWRPTNSTSWANHHFVEGILITHVVCIERCCTWYIHAKSLDDAMPS